MPLAPDRGRGGERGLRVLVVVREFKEEFGKGAPRTICIGPRDAVQSVVSLDELSRLFGGYIVYVDTITNQELLGVWRARKVTALRSLLRVRGMSMELKRTRPRSIRLKHYSTLSNDVRRPIS
jgi:hypothetical protein